MHKILAYCAFGWLALSGVLHFIADVVSQYVRGKRLPGLETTYYYGLHTSYALGQVLFGILALLVLRHAPSLFDRWSTRSLTLAAFLGWAAISVFFIEEYWQPKANIAIFGVLLILALLKHPRQRPIDKIKPLND